MNKERLLRLADYIELVPNESWSYTKWHEYKEDKPTEQRGCAIVQAAYLFEKENFPLAISYIPFCNNSYMYLNKASFFEFFGLNEDEFLHVFLNLELTTRYTSTGTDATQKEVADLIRNFVNVKFTTTNS